MIKIGFTSLRTLSPDCFPSLSFFGGTGVAFLGCTAVVSKALLFVSFFVISVILFVLSVFVFVLYSVFEVVSLSGLFRL
jgi:hypothetical protein